MPERDRPPHATRPEFSAVVRAEAAFVMRLTVRLGVRPMDTEDVAQEVFLTLHRLYLDWNPETPLRSFLFGIVRRVVANYRRKLRTLEQTKHSLRSEPSELIRSPLQELERADARAVLELALQRLDDEKREVFVLFELEEMPMDEIASWLGCPLKTAYSRLYAARELVSRAVLLGERSTRDE